MTIEVIRKEVWGNELTYVKEESVRNSVRKLTGRKSLTISDIEALKELGFVLIRRYDSERL
jgi:hypothetical protein|tara:strand:- start:408 stop:590 length:183 start_codon:yes stop_codon:yes gene_type:complete